jgi:AhpD family alkylhydroperoxidase
MLALEQYLDQCGLEQALIHLVKLRVSQMNGCAFCIDMHWKELRALGDAKPDFIRSIPGANAHTTAAGSEQL